MSSNYHLEWKTFIKASGISNLQNKEKNFFIAGTFESLCVVTIQTE